LSYNEKNIAYVLSAAKNKKFIYFEDDFFHFVSVEEATQRILYLDPESGIRHVATKFQDTKFFIWFFKDDNGLLIFSIGSFVYRWNRDFGNGLQVHTIDFSRYIRLMLQICGDVPIVELSTFSDTIDNLLYKQHDCITAAVNIGYLDDLQPGNNDEVKWSMKYFLSNGIQNGFTFFDENTKQHIEPSAQKCYAVLKADFPVYLYATKDDVPFKIEIKKNNDDMYDFVSVYPLEPYQMEKGYGNDEKKIDLAFYVQCLIELCENFAIYELKSFL